MFWELSPRFVEVTGEKLLEGEGPFLVTPTPNLNSVKEKLKITALSQLNTEI